jgi:ubiquinone/menaquinone biosynthesis C-methylase UbiE
MPIQGATEHWERTWSETAAEEVSWFEATPASSLAMIEELSLPPEAAIIDLGGGASGLAGELLAHGHTQVTVADISAAALEQAKARLGDRSPGIEWVVADARSHDFGRHFDLWHDRAVLHFMVDEPDRRGYIETLKRSLAPDGHVIVATFGPAGPTSCSGLPVARYDAAELANALAPAAELVSSHLEEHVTPSGSTQQYLYARLDAKT